MLICLSNIPVITGNTEIGLLLFMSCFSPFLKIGVTFAFFRSSVYIPFVILRFKIVV